MTDTAHRALEAWPSVAEHVQTNPALARDMAAGIEARAKAFLATRGR